MGWADAASEAAREAGVDLGPYRHRVVVLPTRLASWAGQDCTWAGLGTVGPAGHNLDGTYSYGYVWINGDHAQKLQVGRCWDSWVGTVLVDGETG